MQPRVLTTNSGTNCPTITRKPYSMKGGRGVAEGEGVASLTSATSQEIFMHIYVTAKLLLHIVVITVTIKYRENKIGNVRIVHARHMLPPCVILRKYGDRPYLQG
jgi:hypothetical protein